MQNTMPTAGLHWARAVRAWILILIATALLGGCSTTTVILVRHAEKGPGKDPDLTALGQERAAALVDVTQNLPVTAIYHTQYKRTLQTARPVAAAFTLEPTQIDVLWDMEQVHALLLVEHILQRHRGETVLVVGHSNTLPLILAAFGTLDPPDIAHDCYDDLFIVTVKSDGSATVVHDHYGP